MKNISLFILLSVFLFAGCSEQNDIRLEQTEITEETYELLSKENLSVINGVLNFGSVDSYYKISSLLGQLSDSDRDKWEEGLGFVSLRSEVNRVMAELAESADESAFMQLLNENSDILKMEDGTPKPIIEADFYAAVANREGLFHVEGACHKVFVDKIAISRTGSEEEPQNVFNEELKNGNSEVEVFDYRLKSSLKSSGCGDSMSRQFVKGDRKCVLSGIVYIEVVGNSSSWDIYRRVVFRITVKNERKNFWGNWKSYHAGCEVRDINLIVNAPVVTGSWTEVLDQRIINGQLVVVSKTYSRFTTQDIQKSYSDFSASGVQSSTRWYHVGDQVRNREIENPEFIKIRARGSNTGIGLGVNWVEITCGN